MSNRLRREDIWGQLKCDWDLIIIGGGITGAGIFREAVRQGLRTVLIEAQDFASGTSSRSSKLVHGGFRYLKNGQVKLTYESVRERERLLREGRGLVNQLGFLLANFDGDQIPGWVFGAGLTVYDLLALQWGHRRYDAYDMRGLCPILTDAGLQGGYRYFDAQTDDSRLVLRLIQEGIQMGGLALNYVRVLELLRDRSGAVSGAAVQDQEIAGSGRTLEISARAVINATGAWADDLRSKVGGRPRLRKLRGSHLIFSNSRLPLTRAVSFLHPGDQRPVFAFPWEGVTLFGTTDVDLDEPLSANPHISPAELDYLLEAVQYAFPCLELTSNDIQTTFAGVRPVVNTSKADPSKESREHVLWNDNGLLTVAGGKLTTFRLMARDALKRVCPAIPDRKKPTGEHHMLTPPPAEIHGLESLPHAIRQRLTGRHGANTQALADTTRPDELRPVENTSTLWSEIRWSARSEAVIHLEDLMLRRTRLGLVLPNGGMGCLDQIRQIAQPELGWDDQRWLDEENAYAVLWKECYYHCE